MSMEFIAKIARDWAARCFPGQIDDPATRALRLVEEAIELCQAVGVERGDIDTVLKTVYCRPPGTPYQEMGGTLLTSIIMCEALEYDFESTLIAELRRVLDKPTEHFTRRNSEKINVKDRSEQMILRDAQRRFCSTGKPPAP